MKAFHENLWNRDMQCLNPRERNYAEQVLKHVTRCLDGRPYHRESKRENKSDRQTIVRHPETDKWFLVISVSPEKPGGSYRLRIDFADRGEKVRSDAFQIDRAPQGQWKTKGERRFVVNSEIRIFSLILLLDQIFEVNRPKK